MESEGTCENSPSSSSSSSRCAGQRFNRTLEVRPGRISRKLELDYDYYVNGMIQNYYSVCWCLVVWSPLDRY